MPGTPWRRFVTEGELNPEEKKIHEKELANLDENNDPAAKDQTNNPEKK